MVTGVSGASALASGGASTGAEFHILCRGRGRGGLIFLPGHLRRLPRRRRRPVLGRGGAGVDAGIQAITGDDADAGRNGIAVTARETLGGDGTALLRQRKDGRNARGLGATHGVGVMVVITLRTGIDAVGADARLGEIEINLHDPPLRPHRLDEDGEIGFDAFAEIAAALP